MCGASKGAHCADICRKRTALHYLPRRLMPSLVYQALRRYAKPVPSAFPHRAAGLGLTGNGCYLDSRRRHCLFAIGFAEGDVWWMVVGGCRGLGGEEGCQGLTLRHSSALPCATQIVAYVLLRNQLFSIKPRVRTCGRNMSQIPRGYETRLLWSLRCDPVS